MVNISSPLVNTVILTRNLFVLCIIAIGIGCSGANEPMTIKSPPPAKLPSPNAYDYYLQAYQKLQQSAEATIYNGEALGPVWSSLTPNEEPTAKKELAIAVTGDALELLREGFKYPYQAPLKRSYKALFPFYVKFRDIARYLKLRASVLASQGDWNGSVSSNLDALRLGNDPPKDGTLISMLVGISLQSFGQKEIWQSIEHLNATDARNATQRMEKIVTGQTSLLDCLQGEKLFVQASLLDLFKQPHWREVLAYESKSSTENQEQYPTKIIPKISEKRIFSYYTKQIDLVIAEARKPYLTRKPVDPPSPIFSSMLSNYYFSSAKVAVNEVVNALLLTTLALQTYKAEHGAYPASLTDLIPAYLNTLPTDPFTDSLPLHYLPTADKYLLYSIGPDGKDDRGQPIDSGQNSLLTRYQIFPSNKPGSGDIVAGVNIS